jgi:hypothetical protein
MEESLKELLHKKLDFSNMLFRVDKFGMEKEIVKEYPELFYHRELAEFKMGVEHKELVIRFIILAYTIESPFVIKFQDKLLRFQAILDYLGINRGNLRHEDCIKHELPMFWLEIYYNRNEKFNDFLQVYLTKVIRNYEFKTLVMYEDLWEQNAKQIKGLEAESNKKKGEDDDVKPNKIKEITDLQQDKYKLLQDNEEMLTKMTKLKDIIYMKDKKLANVLHKRAISPENFQRRK